MTFRVSAAFMPPNLQPNSSDSDHPAGMPLLGGRYQIVSQLGAGGFGQTFLAQDRHMPGQPKCVVKQLKPQVNNEQELQVARRLFDTEAKVLSQLGDHPQIPRLLAHFEESAEFYLVQELIEGHSLQEDVAAVGATVQPWREAQTVGFLGDILGTLAFVHDNRVIHRDLKPSNLIRRQHDGRIVLIDFGAVKQVSTQLVNAPSSLGRTISIGTQGYMPTEQVSGHPHFSSDVYAVGMIAIQGLIGRHPSMLSFHSQTGELDWHSFVPTLHPALIHLLDAMVRYDFRSRYATASQALAALAQLPPALSQYISVPDVPTSDMSISTGAQLGFSQEVTEKTDVKPVAITAKQSSPPLFSQASSLPDANKTLSSQANRSSRGILWPIFLGAGSVGLVAASVLAWKLISSTSSVPVLPTVENPSNPGSAPVAVITPEPVPEPVPEPTPELGLAPTPDEAIATLKTFYNKVSNREWEAARSLFSEELAKTFRSEFFEQFDRVTVENLIVIGETAETLTLIGNNTYFYQDGTTQEEERTYILQLIDGEPRIIASNFVRITKRRS